MSSATLSKIEIGKTTITAEPGKPEVTMTRIFDAPRERVFRAITDPQLIKRWWGPRRLTTIVDKMDVKPGGQWRFINRDAQGNEYAFHGVYREVVPNKRLTYTFEFEGTPGHTTLETETFEDFGGKTIATDRIVFPSVADRDEMLKAGMLEGGTESMDRFAAIVERRWMQPPTFIDTDDMC